MKKQDDEVKDVNKCLYDPSTVQTAFSVIKQLNQKYYEEEAKKEPLLDDPQTNSIYMQLVLKKIPHLKDSKTVQVRLPHSLLNDNTDVCLITGDLDKNDRKAESDPVVLHYKELLKTKGVNTVTEVVPLRQLRTEYKTFESKRHLAAAYDVFLADKKIAQCLPRLLGKPFYKCQKYPVQINMGTSNLKQEIEKALSKTKFFLTGRGTSYAWKVARVDMTEAEAMRNVEACLEALTNQIPGGWENIKGLFLKTSKSKAIPFYISFGNPRDVYIERKRKIEDPEESELTTLPNVNVKVFKDGRITVIKSEEKDGDEVDEFSPRKLRKHKKAKREEKEHKKQKTEKRKSVKTEKRKSVKNEKRKSVKNQEEEKC